MHEIITLQFGHFSNYIATHFWNTQEAYFTYGGDEKSLVDHNVHWRPGLGADGSETFLPRTVIYDLKGGFGSLRRTNALYEADQGPPTRSDLWNGPTVSHEETPLAKSPYQQSLEQGVEHASSKLTAASVRFWSDYNRVFFHPRSAVQMYDYELNSSVMPFDFWSRGKDLFESLDKDQDLLDRDVRPFVEESDRMQGFQVFATIDDAWGGFSSSFAERLRDEYGKACIWAWGASPSAAKLEKKQQLLKAANIAQSLTSMSDTVSVLVPIAAPKRLPSHVHVNRSLPWHLSALFETATEGSILPSRLRSVSGLPDSTLDSLVGILNNTGGRPVANLALDVGEEPSYLDRTGSLRSNANASGNDAVTETDSIIPLSDYLTACDIRPRDRPQRGQVDDAFFGRIQVHRHSIAVDPKRSPDAAVGLDSHPRAGSIVRRYDCDLTFPIPDSFPPIYLAKADGLPANKSIKVNTRLATDTSISNDLKSLRSLVVPVISSLERESLGNRLAELQEAYNDGWASDSDDDDD